MSCAVTLLLLLLAGPDQTHTSVLKTDHFEIRYRPGSRAGAAAPRTAVMLERELARVSKQLGIPADGSYVVFLYDGAPELQVQLGMTGVSGASFVNKVHIPWDNDQTRVHELTHVITYRMPKSGDEPRNMFFPDGIANALLEHVSGVHVHAVAAHLKRGRKLPSLAEMTGTPDFYGWMKKRPGFNAYDVAASWFRWLIDEHGMEKTRRYYTGTSVDQAFGQPLARLEKAWLAFLDRYELSPEVVTLLDRRNGKPARFDVYPLDPFARLPEDYRGKESQWKDVTGAKMSVNDKASWSREGGVLTGKSTSGAWSWCELGTKKYKDAILCATIRCPPECGALQVRFGPECQGMCVANGTFLFNNDRAVGKNGEESLARRTGIHLTLVRRKGKVEVWIDGFKVLTTNAVGGAALPGVGVAGSTAQFSNVSVRALR